MSTRPRRLGLLAALLVATAPAAARAEPAAVVLPLPFAIAQMRAPESEVATAVATSSLLRGAGAAPAAGIVVAWGETGAAALALVEGAVRARPLDPAGVAEIAAVETPRDALPGSRRAVMGPLTATLAQPAAGSLDGAFGPGPNAAAVVIRERKPVPRSAEPKPVPVDVATVEAGPGAVFEDRTPRLVSLDGRPVVVTIRRRRDTGASLALIERGPENGPWRILAETPPTATPQPWLNPAGIADFLGTGHPQIALVSAPHGEGVLQLFEVAGGRPTLAAQAAGYADHVLGSPVQDLAAVVETQDGPLLAVPTRDRQALALVSFKGGLRERVRIPLPAPAATGVAVLGRGSAAHVLVGLADGRLADIALSDLRPGGSAP